MRFKHTILSLAILCAGCVSNSRPPEPSEPVAGLNRARQRQAYTGEQVIQIYLTNVTFGDWYLARLAAACDVLADVAATPDARYEALRLKSIQGAAVYSILTSPNPIVQVLSLQTVIELTRLKWVSEGKAISTFGDRGRLLVDALEEMQKRARSNALGVISEEELNSIRESALRWRSENPDISDIEFIRFDNFVTEMAHSLAQQEQTDLVANIQSAVNGLTETRLLGVRSLYLMSRIPRMVEWELAAQMADAARRPETKTFMDNMSRMTRTAEEVQGQATHLQGAFDSLPDKLANAFAAQSVFKDALSTANAAVLRGQAATTQLGAVEASVRRLDDSVGNLTRQFDRLNRSYDPEAVQHMADAGRLIAAHEARALIYLITACVAGLIVLHAVLGRRWRRRAIKVRETPIPSRML
jgi:hypothetical protein